MCIVYKFVLTTVQIFATSSVDIFYKAETLCWALMQGNCNYVVGEGASCQLISAYLPSSMPNVFFFLFA